ncbi:Hpt domain-containing protein [Marivita sp. XM-24bin2]|jgi:HPt (histidine-containing phosphotransfer) domain-containing protein|uniref:Hpt domain-containing protein n=1 Tax=unclassified Marivita TaxID=2632480 RepID=UPI000D7A5DBA|nr:Hpt domain-containing protein [Marivita sp. XM-24bin2]MCR9110198.1 Hpt domain-containing protein [Paracoccaceae bacterium]PWL34543.1 MAG: histidine kinase [Marivita sp. XM-24bin2]
MIDWIRVSELRDEIGAEDFAEVADLFLMEVEETLSQLDGPKHNVVQIREMMHFLKGSALNLGFCKLADVCNAAELAAAQGEVDIDIPAVQDLYTASREQFESEYAQRFAA